jgi:hypothetical protein
LPKTEAHWLAGQKTAFWLFSASSLRDDGHMGYEGNLTQTVLGCELSSIKTEAIPSKDRKFLSIKYFRTYSLG